jgi:hypothetical protein
MSSFNHWRTPYFFKMVIFCTTNQLSIIIIHHNYGKSPFSMGKSFWASWNGRSIFFAVPSADIFSGMGPGPRPTTSAVCPTFLGGRAYFLCSRARPELTEFWVELLGMVWNTSLHDCWDVGPLSIMVNYIHLWWTHSTYIYISGTVLAKPDIFHMYMYIHYTHIYMYIYTHSFLNFDWCSDRRIKRQLCFCLVSVAACYCHLRSSLM